VQRDELKSVPPAEWAPTPVARMKSFVKKHGRKLWWVHSIYALGIGISVVVFAQRGFEHARWLAASIVLVWLLVVAFFRVFTIGRKNEAIDSSRAGVVPFFAMTYVLKNLYQGMLFFLLPFYFRSTTFPSYNSWFVVVLAVCAVLSTLDIVFDRVLFRFRWLASVFHALTLFACALLAVPALFSHTRALVSLLVATGISIVAFFSIHLRAKWAPIAAPLALAAFLPAVYFARRALPPVPLYVAHGAAGTMLLPDGRLGMEVTRLHASLIDKLACVTDVAVPGGQGDAIVHVWRRQGEEVRRAKTVEVAGQHGTARLRSSLGATELPRDLAGKWEIDVETDDGQLIGRVGFWVDE